MDANKVTRGSIIRSLAVHLKDADFVRAFWEGGAEAFGMTDQWSDIDAYVIVQNGKADEGFAVAERALNSVSPIKVKLDIPQTPWPGVSQAFYKLEGASEYLVIDLAIIEERAQEKFLAPQVHGSASVCFDKSGVTANPGFDGAALSKRLRSRLERLRLRRDIFACFLQKEVNRGNSLEALDLYRVLVLGTITELLRMKNNPHHFDFGMRYVHRELPLDDVRRLERLSFVSDMTDLRVKADEAMDWLSGLLEGMDLDEIDKKLGLR